MKDAAQAQVRIIEHADIKRMLLAQKSYSEGALALELYCAKLVDEQHTGDAVAADEARLLLEVLTPIAKSWPSEWCLEANSLAIQIHGGYGYTRDFPVEQYWRDNRLNMIHEGTHGIQGMDLLGRKVLMEEGRGVHLLGARMRETADKAMAFADLAADAKALNTALQKSLRPLKWPGLQGSPKKHWPTLCRTYKRLDILCWLGFGWMSVLHAEAHRRRLKRVVRLRPSFSTITNCPKLMHGCKSSATAT